MNFFFNKKIEVVFFNQPEVISIWKSKKILLKNVQNLMNFTDDAIKKWSTEI